MHLYNVTVAKESLWYFLCLMSNMLMIAQNTKVVRANTSMKLLLMLTVLAMVGQTLLHLFLCPFFFFCSVSQNGTLGCYEWGQVSNTVTALVCVHVLC